MARRKQTRSRVIFQVRKAAASLDRVLDHLMAADVLAKGGAIDGHGKLLPAGVDIMNPDKDGHPVLNEWLPVILQLITSTQEAIKKLAAKI